MSIEALSLLTAGSVNPAAVSGRPGGGDSLTKSEIAGLLSGLTQTEMAFAQAKFMGDEQAVRCVLIITRTQAEKLSVRSRWKVRPSQVITLADVATHEVISPCRCAKCNGVGYRVNRACLACGGTGYGHESVRSMASAIGVDESAFRRNWKDKLSSVLSLLYDIENQVRLKVYLNSRLTTSAL